MALSADLISQFVKITNDKNETKTEEMLQGKVQIIGNKNYVRLSSSDVLTPVHTTTELKNGDMVNVLIKDHTATVLGNVTAPSMNEDTGTTLAEHLKSGEITGTREWIDSIVEGNADVKESIKDVKRDVDLKMDSEGVKIQIKTAIKDIHEVTTNTGYSFTDEGLKISKSTSPIETTITENGMKIKSGVYERLVADKDGVSATNLHAKTFLTINEKCRIEPYGSDRLACFWIGG